MRVVRVMLWVLCAGYWIALFTLTHVPRVPVVVVGGLYDKVGHFLAYGVLAGLLYLALWASKSRGGRPGALVITIALLYGAVDEITQPLVGRSGEFLDWVADAAGAVLTVGIVAGVRRISSGGDGPREGGA